MSKKVKVAEKSQRTTVQAPGNGGEISRVPPVTLPVTRVSRTSPTTPSS
jgi:hypothetical protein